MKVADEPIGGGDEAGLISTYSVVLPLNHLLRLCGLGRHLQPAGSSCFQFFDLSRRTEKF